MRGQSLLEFGLTLPFILLVMYGLIETGRLVFIYASVVSAAREGAQYGSASGLNGTIPFYNDCGGIKTTAKRLGFIQAFQDSDIVISLDSGPGTSVLASQCGTTTAFNDNLHRVTVQVSTNYAPIVPLVPFASFTIRSSSSRTIVTGIPQ
jgi:Flp pilus assembly protein TadG